MKIQVLEPSVSSKIAAGEVIERPVSVVKEAVENSIDSGSKNITIQIKGSGKDLIRITDDGSGIARDEISSAFMRHSTSKIRSVEDIFGINTMGFRGEALSSIAAVSHVTLTTKTKAETVGSQFRIIGGVEKGIKDVPSKRGCSLEVKDLFYNTPARLKFLKSNAQETSRITELITRMAMGNPNISFRFINEGREVFYTSGNGDLREAIAKVHGTNVARHMIPIELDFDQGNIFGYISPPQYCRGNRTFQTYFVNRRYISDQGLSRTVDRAYKTLLTSGHFPICTIFIEVDPSKIDVNVHPAKTQIKFQQEREIQKALYDAIVSGLESSCLIPQEKIGKTLNKDTAMIRAEDGENESLLKDEYFPMESDNILSSPAKKVPLNVRPGKVNDDGHSYKVNVAVGDDAIAEDGPKKDVKVGPLKSVRIVGQLFNTYIVAQGDGKFYIIDQHAAHEKILFEHYSGCLNLISATQELISPYPLEVSVDELCFIEQHKDFIANMGFDISIFGHNTVLVRSVPYFFDKITDPESLRDVLDHIEDPEYTAFDTKGKLVASMACHSAIKAGDPLSIKEMMELIIKLNTLENPYTCPHGRPIIISTTLYDLEKKFKRVK